MRSLYIGLAGMAVVGIMTTACGSSSNNSTGTAGSGSQAGSGSSAQAASGSSVIKTTSVSGATVLTNSAGMVLYWFVPDTSTKSSCNGSCASYWPPVKGPVTAGSGVTGTLGTITRSDGTTQATWNGHPLYTYATDKPGQATGNGINIDGGVWHEVTLSGSAPASGSSTGSGSGGGYGY